MSDLEVVDARTVDRVDDRRLLSQLMVNRALHDFNTEAIEYYFRVHTKSLVLPYLLHPRIIDNLKQAGLHVYDTSENENTSPQTVIACTWIPSTFCAWLGLTFIVLGFLLLRYNPIYHFNEILFQAVAASFCIAISLQILRPQVYTHTHID